MFLTIALLAAPAQLPPALITYLRHEMHTEPNARVNIALVDLNRDGRKEAIVQFVNGPNCTDAGCRLLILTPTRHGYRAVGDVPRTRPSVRIADTSSHGWRDVATLVPDGQGGFRNFRLTFDGQRYPGNPIAPPVINRRGSPGKVVIAEGDPGKSLSKR